MKLKASLFLLSLASSLAYAETSAPVFDVDSLSNDNASQQDNAARASAAPVVSVVPQASAQQTDMPVSTEQRLARLEQQLGSPQQNEMANRLASMQGEVQALRGQVEELSHRLQELLSQQRQQSSDNDKQQLSKANPEPSMSALPRVGDEEPVSTKASRSKSGFSGPALTHNKTAQKASPAKFSKALPEKAPAATVQPNGAEEQAVYQTAYNLIKAKKYSEAIGALQKMLLKYPSGQFAANAHYWLGELYSLTGQHEQAATEFSAVVKHYPSNPRVADSELKLGLIYATELKWPEAKTSFSKVVHQYPGTPSARLALEQLKQLKLAGH